MIVPSNNEFWKEGLAIAMQFQAPDQSITREREKLIANRHNKAIPDALVNSIAKLAGCDGAIVITSDLELVGFGAKISAKTDFEDLIMIKPENIKAVNFETTGGTRHQSAAHFVARYQDCVAIVVSTDHHVTIMYWDSDVGVLICKRY